MIDNIDLLFELIDIDAELHTEQSIDLGIFGSQAAQMAKDFDEIDQYGIDAGHLFNYVVQNKKLEIWNFDEAKSKEKELKYLQFFTSLYDYYLRLHDRLTAKSQGYYGMITRHLAQMSDPDLSNRIGERKVVFAGFNALTTTEERPIDKLVKDGRAEILFDYDRYYIDDPNNEAGLFARRYLDDHPEWMKNGVTHQLCQEEKHIHIVSSSGNTLQTKALQSNLQKIGNSDAAVILSDESLLIPALNAIPDTEAFKEFKVSMGYPIKNTPVNQFIRSYFDLRRRKKTVRKLQNDGREYEAKGWYIWPIFRIMDLELTKTVFSKSEMMGFEHWKNELVTNGKFIFEETDFAKLNRMPDIESFLRLLLTEQEEHQNQPKETIQSLRQLLSFISNKIQGKTGQKGFLFLLNQVSAVGKIVNRIGLIVEQHADYLHDANSVEILYKLLVSNTSIKLSSSGTEGLQIMGLLEARNLDFKQIHVLSVNEGIMPNDKSQGSFIPHFIRKECGLPCHLEKQAVFAYNFYRLLQNGENIFLYYNDLSSTFGGEASRYILQIKQELAKSENIHVKEETFSCDTHSNSTTLSLTANKSHSLDRIRYLVQEKGLSPSSLSTYISCPLKYYLRYIEQIEDDSAKEEVGTNIIGTIIHDSLELLFNDYLPKDGKLQTIDKELFDNRIMPQWEAMLSQSIEKNMPLGFPDIGFNYLNKITIRQQLRNYLQYTSSRLKNQELTILKTEGELSARLATSVGDCLFKGRTDRIDRWGNIIRVIDYKTGKVESADLKVPVRHPDDGDLAFVKSIPEKALQLLLYKYMYLKENQEIAAHQVEAQIHGLRYATNIEFALKQSKPALKETSVPFLGDDTFVADMESMLKALVAELLDTETPFRQTDDEKKCRNCDFRGICRR